MLQSVNSIDIKTGNFIEISGKTHLLKSIKTLCFLPTFAVL